MKIKVTNILNKINIFIFSLFKYKWVYYIFHNFSWDSSLYYETQYIYWSIWIKTWSTKDNLELLNGVVTQILLKQKRKQKNRKNRRKRQKRKIKMQNLINESRIEKQSKENKDNRTNGKLTGIKRKREDK